ncbi:MAG TPA: GNAT family protein [Candidatus Sulfotelmatobacter sp.]|nr:GNAT family protein [Candidatus Sulfotelmatobacter sp.]
MGSDSFVLSGNHIRLEPLKHHHAGALVAASNGDASLYRWSPVPQTMAEATRYIDTAIAWHEAGSAVPFAVVQVTDNRVIGSTRFWNIERWAWPEGHPSRGRASPDACEIGYTWYTRSSIRTVANTECKFLMLRHAFEIWQTLRVCFHTDVRNERSRAALERIGAKFEGVLRAHRMAADFIPRDSCRYSIIAAEWHAVKSHLQGFLQR